MLKKIVTKNGESYIAIIDAERLDYYHQLERERIHLLLIEDARNGLEHVAAGNIKDAHRTLSAIKRRRASGTAGSSRSTWRDIGWIDGVHAVAADTCMQSRVPYCTQRR